MAKFISKNKSRTLLHEVTIAFYWPWWLVVFCHIFSSRPLITPSYVSHVYFAILYVQSCEPAFLAHATTVSPDPLYKLFPFFVFPSFLLDLGKAHNTIKNARAQALSLTILVDNKQMVFRCHGKFYCHQIYWEAQISKLWLQNKNMKISCSGKNMGRHR